MLLEPKGNKRYSTPVRIFITGVCGFVGSELALGLRNLGHHVCGFDNFCRKGSERNKEIIERVGVNFWEGDVRFAEQLELAGDVDWVIDAAALPSVLSGIGIGIGIGEGSRVLMETNLWGTVNMLEFCKRRGAGLILLSTSRVYSIDSIRTLPLKEKDRMFTLARSLYGVGENGLTENFPTTTPISLYGASKLSSEILALEYGHSFGFPVVINRCGLMAGGGQFGTAEQGIVNYWIRNWIQGKPLRYLGFGGSGLQTRDCLHPRDLVQLVNKQINSPPDKNCQVFNVGGGVKSGFSLKQLSDWCLERIGYREVGVEMGERPFDVPWVILDAERAKHLWDWRPETSTLEIFEEIVAANHQNISRGEPDAWPR